MRLASTKFPKPSFRKIIADLKESITYYSDNKELELPTDWRNKEINLSVSERLLRFITILMMLIGPAIVWYYFELNPWDTMISKDFTLNLRETVGTNSMLGSMFFGYLGLAILWLNYLLYGVILVLPLIITQLVIFDSNLDILKKRRYKLLKTANSLKENFYKSIRIDAVIRCKRKPYILENGDEYIGSLKNGIKCGRGAYVWFSGGKYEGQFKQDKFEGKGRRVFSDGSKYEGEFKNDKFHGLGTYYFQAEDEAEKYVGHFKNDKMHSSGKLYFKDNDIWQGKFKNDEQIDGSYVTE